MRLDDSEILRAFSHRNQHKAIGSDLIPPSFYKNFPELALEIFGPIYHFCARNFVEPILWKGGPLYCFPKKSGDLNVKGQRGVLLEDTSAVIFHSQLRAKLLPPLHSYLLLSLIHI